MKRKFRKAHYEAIASVLREVLKDPTAHHGNVWGAVYHLANMFEKDNPLFDADKFVAACEPPRKERQSDRPV